MKNLLTYLLAIMAFVACSDSGTDNGGGGGGQETPKQPEITLSTTAANFTTDGGSDVITFTSSEAWTAEVINSRADDWCSIDPKSGAAGSAKITVTTTANDTPDDRTASIIIKAGTASKTINVSQKQKDALTVTSSKFEVSAEGGEITIEVKANINFDFEIDDDAEDWITHRSTRALKTSQLVFEIDENEDTENRKANISISSGNLRETVTIYQEGNEPTIVLSDDEFTVSSSKETIAIDVKSNVDVAVEIPSNVKWIKENTTRAFSTNTYYFDIEQNDGYDNRTAEIKFTNNENGIYEKVKITQMQRDAIVVAESEYTLNEDGGELDFEIKTNVDIEVSISDNAKSWIKQVETRGLKSKTLHFDIAANNTDNDREGTITITGGDATQTIKVKQIVTPCQIIYTSTDGKIITPNTTDFGGAKIVSNVYENGQGVITFDKTITSIPKEAFKSKTKLVTISLPESVTSIDNYAFTSCTALEAIYLPPNITTIGQNAFANCPSLKNTYISDIKAWCEIRFSSHSNPMYYGAKLYLDGKLVEDLIIPDGITKIQDYAFAGCNSLKSVIIPEGVTAIGRDAFRGCSSMASINISSSITEIGISAFDRCTLLKSVYISDIEAWCNINFDFSNPLENGANLYLKGVLVENLIIPDGVNKISSHAFRGCTSLTNVTISNDIKEIGMYTFYGCTALTGISISGAVTKIGQHAFYGCTSLTDIYIPDNITQIGHYAFAQCASLQYINMPDSLTSIDNYVFSGCSSLDGIIIPHSVTSIERSAFEGCSSLTDITIPNSVVKIGEAAFHDCSALTKVSIGENVTEIDKRAFADCRSLTNIVIPNSITSIESDTFKFCLSLTSITIPNSVTKIGNGAFFDCDYLTSITIPNSVVSIGEQAFYCDSLKEIYCRPTTPPTLGHSAFYYNVKDLKFYVPEKSVNAYKTADRWKAYADKIIGYDF